MPDNQYEADADELQIPLPSKMSSRDRELGNLVNAIAAKIRPEDLDPQPPPDVSAAKRADTRPSLFASLPPQLVAEIPEERRSVLATMSALTVETSLLVVRFVQQPEWMLQLLYEEHLSEAKASGAPLPPQPPTSLSYEERKTIHDILVGMVPAHFVMLCKLIHAFTRKYGLEVLGCLPTPPPPLPAAERQRLQSALANPQKLSYLHYVFEWQESLLRSLPLPPEPSISVSAKERNQLRRMMRDLRAVMLFEKQARPPLSFLQR